MPKSESNNTIFYRKNQAFKFDFSAGQISSDGGVLLCEKIERKHKLLQSFSRLLPDNRNPLFISYSREEQLKQRVYLMMQGYEDCNDEEKLQNDPVIKQVIGNKLCSQPTLCRFENAVSKRDIWLLCHWFVDRYVSSLPEGCKEVVLDVDSTDDPTHGNQQLSLFNGYYYQWMYHELIINDGQTGQLVLPVLRPGSCHTAKWFVAIFKRIIKKLRARFPELVIKVRADCGFSGAEFYKLSNEEGIQFCIGISANEVLKQFTAQKESEIRETYLSKKIKYQEIIGPFEYQAKSWEKAQDVYAKVESTGKGMNIRYIVSNIPNQTGHGLYWGFYVKRGDTSENRIKEIKNMCYSDRLSCHGFWPNFFRFMLSCLCYEMFRLIKALIATTGTTTALSWQVSNIRLYLLKIGATIKERARTITIKFSKAFVYQDLLSNLLRI
ncbi:MAG: IS1380 family transposase [Chloroflexia bacterium]|nr:IS1380 family transposase [Chloroflexia bacterium]